MTKQQAQARIDALQQQVDDAAAAEQAATAAVQAAQAAQAATNVVAGHVFSAVAGAVPVPATPTPTPAARRQRTVTPTPAATTPVPQQAVPTPATPVVVPPVVQQTTVVPTVAQPVAAAPAAAPAAQSANPRHWSWVQWVCAILVGLFAFWVARRTVGGVSDFFDLRGVPDWVLRAFWYLGVTGTGFFGAALLTVNALTAILRGFRQGRAQARAQARNRRAIASGNQAQP
jgi:hypothetical protein